jgi:hypothetical protein
MLDELESLENGARTESPEFGLQYSKVPVFGEMQKTNSKVKSFVCIHFQPWIVMIRIVVSRGVPNVDGADFTNEDNITDNIGQNCIVRGRFWDRSSM